MNIRVNLNKKIKVIQSFDLFITSKKNSIIQSFRKILNYRNIIQIISTIISDNVISNESLQLFWMIKKTNEINK